MDIKNLLIDIDGVLWEWEKPIPGAIETIDWLNKNGYKYLLVSSITRFPKDVLMSKLAGIGFNISKENILPLRQMTIEYIKGKKPGAKVFIIGPADFDKEFEEAGLKPTRSEDTVDFVVTAYDPKIDFELMSTALRMLLNGAELVATNKSRYFSLDGRILINMGVIVAGLEYATGKEATVIGKPNANFFRIALKKLGAKAEETAMVGDVIGEDILGAKETGLHGILVRTGAFKEEHLKQSGVKPDAVINSISDLPKILKTF